MCRKNPIVGSNKLLDRCLCHVDLVSKQTMELDQTKEGTEIDRALPRTVDAQGSQFSPVMCAEVGTQYRGVFSLPRTGTLPAVFDLAPPQLLEKGYMELQQYDSGNTVPLPPCEGSSVSLGHTGGTLLDSYVMMLT